MRRLGLCRALAAAGDDVSWQRDQRLRPALNIGKRPSQRVQRRYSISCGVMLDSRALFASASPCAEAMHLRGEAEVRFRAAAQPRPRRRAAAFAIGAAVNDQARHNLPYQTTSFIGREDDVAQVQQSLGEAGC